jgi:hypothetical protein
VYFQVHFKFSTSIEVWLGNYLKFRPMKIDIVFLVPARMGFICCTKIFHYSLFLKNRLNKTPNWSSDQSLIAAFRKRNSNCIFLKILLARMPLLFMSAIGTTMILTCDHSLPVCFRFASDNLFAWFYCFFEKINHAY